MLKRVPSRLPDEIEHVITRVIGCLIEVHKILGPGLLESVYSKAVRVELGAAGIPFECEKEVPVVYRGARIATHRLDFVVDTTAVLEIKAAERITPTHVAQALTYLKTAHLPVALLVNFNVPVLRQGIRRIVL